MPKGKKNKPPPPPAERTASPPPMRIASPPPPPPHAERTASLPPTPVDLHLTPFEWLNSWPRIRIPDWEELTHDLLHDRQPTFWGSILLALWGLGMDGDKPIDGSVLAVRFNGDATIQVFTGDPGDPRPSWLSAEPPEPPPPSPAPLPPQPLGFSPINTDAYAIKRQLSDREANKIAATDPVDTPASSTPATTQNPKPPTPEPSTSHPRPRTSTPLPKATPTTTFRERALGGTPTSQRTQNSKLHWSEARDRPRKNIDFISQNSERGTRAPAHPLGTELANGDLEETRAEKWTTFNFGNSAEASPKAATPS
ncbi:hypothetical protein BDZ91DRAFT_802804 [Kalaharituber pfeilii]|nr:hypothetical protein BDZ91DRAFT_802804 [Kalaharituber pfeilii]